MIGITNSNVELVKNIHLESAQMVRRNYIYPSKELNEIHFLLLRGSIDSSSSTVLLRPRAGGLRPLPFPSLGDDLSLILIFFRTCCELEPVRPSPSISRSKIHSGLQFEIKLGKYMYVSVLHLFKKHTFLHGFKGGGGGGAL